VRRVNPKDYRSSYSIEGLRSGECFYQSINQYIYTLLSVYLSMCIYTLRFDFFSMNTTAPRTRLSPFLTTAISTRLIAPVPESVSNNQYIYLAMLFYLSVYLCLRQPLTPPVYTAVPTQVVARAPEGASTNQSIYLSIPFYLSTYLCIRRYGLGLRVDPNCTPLTLHHKGLEIRRVHLPINQSIYLYPYTCLSI